MAIQKVLEAYGSDVVGSFIENGSGGHVIKNPSGTAMAQQPNMQFADAHLTNDATNSATEIETFKALTSQEYAQATEDGAYIITDGDGATIGPASEDYVEVMADGEKTRAQLLTDLDALVDWSKVNENSYIVFGNDIYRVNVPNVKIFMTSAISGGHLYNTMFDLKYHTSQQYDTTSNGSTLTDNSSAVPTSGRTITLYYGNKKSIVDLQTMANRCWLNNGQNVEQKFATSILTPTAGTDVTGGLWARLSVTRQANIVCCNLCPITINKTSGAIVATSMPKPLLVNNEQYVQFPLFSSGGASCGYGRLSFDGQMTFNTTGETNYVFCSFTYVTTD